jgi:predicted Na+-dependent transporter
MITPCQLIGGLSSGLFLSERYTFLGKGATIYKDVKADMMANLHVIGGRIMEFFALWNEWLSKRMFLIVLSGLFLGFTLGMPEMPGLRTTVGVLFAYMTFITSLGTSFREFLKVLSRPYIPLWILLLIHVVTPLFAWLLGAIFYPEDHYTRLGYMVVAAVPIGVTSIIWTALNKGNVAVSLVAVTLDTLITPVLLPLFLKYIVGQSLQIDYTQMAMQLLWMITIPSVAGMLLYDFTDGKSNSFAKNIGGFTSKVAFFFVIFINAAMVSPSITWALPVLKMLLVSMLLVAIGYLIGFLGSFIFPQRTQEIIYAMIYSVGLRNISFGVVLAITFFPAPVALPIILGMLFQQPIAAVIPHLFKHSPAQEDLL